MLITVSEYRTIATDKSGNDLPIGGGCLDVQELTAAGSINVSNETQLVRIATDTNVRSNVETPTDAQKTLHPIGYEYFQVVPGQAINFVLA